VRARELLLSYDRNGVLGELTGKDSAGLDRFFREAFRQAELALDDTRRRAREGGLEVRLDGSRLSGVNGGDVWIVGRDGKATRELQKFPGVEAQLLAPSSQDAGKRPCVATERARPLLARCAYNGLWSPSGTNWQPIRLVELSFRDMPALGSSRPGGCGAVVLARRRYQSILGDIAGLCGIEQGSHAESIDLGIWLLVAEQTARSHGWALECLPVVPERQGELAGQLGRILSNRLGIAPGDRSAVTKNLLGSIEADDHYPACILIPHEGKPLPLDENSPGGLRPSNFDHLVASRSTQRVARPGAELKRTVLEDLFTHALDFLHVDHRFKLSFPSFTWQDEFPEAVGKAMHGGIEGHDGLVARACLSGLRNHLAACAELPDGIEAWTCLEVDQLEDAGKDLPLPARLIPPHIRAKLEEGGHFRREEDHLVDHRGRPLSPVRLMKLVRMMSKSFGKFFLGFQNTHPLTGVVLARKGAWDMGPVYQAVGRAVAHMTLLARARGLVSIIKSGPVEIAGAAISDLLVGARPDLEGCEPVLTFQVGLPLGPDDLVEKGRPGEHSGLKERMLDRRAGRAPLCAHYLPSEA
jgi:hypothetical protein